MSARVVGRNASRPGRPSGTLGAAGCCPPLADPPPRAFFFVFCFDAGFGFALMGLLRIRCLPWYQARSALARLLICGARVEERCWEYVPDLRVIEPSGSGNKVSTFFPCSPRRFPSSAGASFLFFCGLRLICRRPRRPGSPIHRAAYRHPTMSHADRCTLTPDDSAICPDFRPHGATDLRLCVASSEIQAPVGALKLFLTTR